MKKKFQKISSKNMRGHWMRRIMHADQKPKQNHKEENLPALHQELFPLKEGIGLTLNQGNILSPSMILRHGNQVHREDDGEVQFWRIKENLRKHFPYCPNWSGDKW